MEEHWLMRHVGRGKEPVSSWEERDTGIGRGKELATGGRTRKEGTRGRYGEVRAGREGLGNLAALVGGEEGGQGR